MNSDTRYLLDELQHCADTNSNVSLSSSQCSEVMGYIAYLESSISNWQDAWKGRRVS